MIQKYLLPILAAGLFSCNNDRKPDHSIHEITKANVNYSDSVNHGLIEKDTLKGSPHLMAMNTINGTHIHIEYGSPGVKERIIWGGLVGYDKVWVTGAHGATTINFSKPVEVGGKKIAAGTYALFTIPGKEKWIVILNTRYNQHLTDDYDEREDIVRIGTIPQENTMTQRLTYTVSNNNNDTGNIIMQWEKLKISIPFKTIQ